MRIYYLSDPVLKSRFFHILHSITELLGSETGVVVFLNLNIEILFNDFNFVGSYIVLKLSHFGDHLENDIKVLLKGLNMICSVCLLANCC